MIHDIDAKAFAAGRPAIPFGDSAAKALVPPELNPEIDVASLANEVESDMVVASAMHPNKTAISSVDTDELVDTLQSVRTIAAEKKAAMDRKIEKIRERLLPEIEQLNADVFEMEQELSDRIKAVGGRGTHTTEWTVRIDQEKGKLVKNVSLLKKLEALLTPAEYASVYKQTPKTSVVEDFDARKLSDLLEFYGDKSEVGQLIASGMYHAPTVAQLIVEPIEVAK
jgi:hypothetical protein